MGILRQAVFGRLAGYEDVNDAEHLRHDPAMRWIVGGNGLGMRGLGSQNGRRETRWLTAENNLSALAELSAVDGQGSCAPSAARRRARHGFERQPDHGEQEMSVWNGHHEAPAIIRCFVFDPFGDLERCALRPGSVTAPTDGRAC